MKLKNKLVFFFFWSETGRENVLEWGNAKQMHEMVRMKRSGLMVDTGHVFSVCQELSSAGRLRGRGIDTGDGR